MNSVASNYTRHAEPHERLGVGLLKLKDLTDAKCSPLCEQIAQDLLLHGQLPDDSDPELERWLTELEARCAQDYASKGRGAGPPEAGPRVPVILGTVPAPPAIAPLPAGRPGQEEKLPTRLRVGTPEEKFVMVVPELDSEQKKKHKAELAKQTADDSEAKSPSGEPSPTEPDPKPPTRSIDLVIS